MKNVSKRPTYFREKYLSSYTKYQILLSVELLYIQHHLATYLSAEAVLLLFIHV